MSKENLLLINEATKLSKARQLSDEATLGYCGSALCLKKVKYLLALV